MRGVTRYCEPFVEHDPSRARATVPLAERVYALPPERFAKVACAHVLTTRDASSGSAMDASMNCREKPQNGQGSTVFEDAQWCSGHCHLARWQVLPAFWITLLSLRWCRVCFSAR